MINCKCNVSIEDGDENEKSLNEGNIFVRSVRIPM